MDLKGLSDPLTNRSQQGWGEWEVNPTVVLNADAGYSGDGSIALLGTSHELAPSDYYLI